MTTRGICWCFQNANEVLRRRRKILLHRPEKRYRADHGDRGRLLGVLPTTLESSRESLGLREAVFVREVGALDNIIIFEIYLRGNQVE